MEQELGLQSCNLKYLREQVDQVFEDIMTDAGVIEPCHENSDAGDGEADAEVFEDDSISYYEPQKIADTAEAEDDLPGGSETWSATPHGTDVEMDEKHIAREENDQAFQNLQLARTMFNDREAAYHRDVAEHADGVKFSREEIDIFHVQLGAELTKDLREAEEGYERTRAHAKALNILVNSIASGPETDGYRESQDPAEFADMVDREYIEWWATGVAEAQEVSSSSPPPSVDWETESVKMCDSCSTYDETPRQRRRIDQWHAEQENLRAVWFSEASKEDVE